MAVLVRGIQVLMTIFPLQMLVCIMSGLASMDAWQCVLVNKQLRAAVGAARVSITATDEQKQRLSNPAQSHLLSQLVKAICTYMPGEVMSQHCCIHHGHIH